MLPLFLTMLKGTSAVPGYHCLQAPESTSNSKLHTLPHMTWRSCCHVSLHHATAMMSDGAVLSEGHLISAGRRDPGMRSVCTDWPPHGST